CAEDERRDGGPALAAGADEREAGEDEGGEEGGGAEADDGAAHDHAAKDREAAVRALGEAGGDGGEVGAPHRAGVESEAERERRAAPESRGCRLGHATAGCRSPRAPTDPR